MDRKVICHIFEKNAERCGLCFDSSLSFGDNFMNKDNNKICDYIKNMFQGINDKYEMNGGKNKFKCKDIEVFQLL